MYNMIDIIVLFASAVLLGISIATALIALRRSRKRNEKLQAAAQLQKWRESGLLVMSDEDFRFALKLGKHDPKQLYHLVRTSRRIIDEQEVEPEEYIQLTVKRVQHADKPESSTGAEPPEGHLELIAEFA